MWDMAESPPALNRFHREPGTVGNLYHFEATASGIVYDAGTHPEQGRDSGLS
jgi:hypothetical protein